MSSKRNLLERLKDGIIVGDGSFGMTLEKRGYLSIGSWTPEATVLYPDAVRQLHRDYLRAGSDVMQTFSFYASDDTLTHKRSTLPEQSKTHTLTFFNAVEEAEWAIETMKETKKPVVCTMRICTVGDVKGVSPQDCAVRMARAGADVLGINCMYDPDICLETLALMKSGLESAGLNPYLIAQPVGYHTKDVATNPDGHFALPEFPFALETRLLSRIDVTNYARKAYDLGVRYIGGCCGFEPYHIRAIAEELAEELGKRPPGADMSPGLEGLKMSLTPSQRERANYEYWNNLTPGTGRNITKKVIDA